MQEGSLVIEKEKFLRLKTIAARENIDPCGNFFILIDQLPGAGLPGGSLVV